MFTDRIKQISFLLPVLIFCFFSGVNAMNAVADSLIQPDTSVIRNDTTAHEGQNNIDTISKDFGNRLKSQLNLTDKQTSTLRSIIASYVENYQESMSNPPAARDIEKILDDTQQASWQSVQSGFWSDLNKRIEETRKK